MPRIVYLVLGTATPRGGHKMALRHVEALRVMGFDAVAWMPEGAPVPSWFVHAAVVQIGGGFRDDDIVVFPEDATNALRQFGPSAQRKVVFCQNHFYAASQGIGVLSQEEVARFEDYMACSQTVAHWLARFMPHRSIEVVPAFADERLFAPGSKTMSIACSPGKRPVEFRAIQSMIKRIHPSCVPWRWAVIENKSEAEVAVMMGSAAIYLSLSRFEGLGMTTLEAMTSGCLAVGFTGIGGREYANSTNGLWAEEDDTVACAEALAKAMAQIEADQPLVNQTCFAARATASAYTYVRFLEALKTFWTRRITK